MILFAILFFSKQLIKVIKTVLNGIRDLTQGAEIFFAPWFLFLLVIIFLFIFTVNRTSYRKPR